MLCGGQSQDPSEPAFGHSNVFNFWQSVFMQLFCFYNVRIFCIAFLLVLLDAEVIKVFKLYRVHSIAQTPLIAVLFFCTQSRCNYKR